MSKVRERQKKRSQRQAMVSRGASSSSQIAKQSQFQLPQIHLPGWRWLLLFIVAALILTVVIFLLALINPPEINTPPHAIWLNANWVYQNHSETDMNQLTTDLQAHQIGAIFLFSSSLRADDTWSGLVNGRNRFSEVEAGIQNTIDLLRQSFPNIKIYSWLEVNATTPSYRLGETEIQNNIADFSKQMVNRLGFDGVLLDIKPIFEENEDYIQLLRNVRREIGVDAQLIVAVPADLTPSGTRLNLPNVIAPGTEWTAEYKQRVALLANQIVITVYNSYQTNPVDYIEWVTYQVDSYIEALSQIESGTTILVSVPLYESKLPAHDEVVENLATGLDGVRRGIAELDELTRPLVAGVAIYTDRNLADADWAIFTEKWLNR
jgi:hypothetical protein